MAKKANKKGTWSQALGSFSFALLLYLTLRWLVLEAYVIPSGSMLPSLLIHDYIFVNKLAYGLRLPFTKVWLLHFTHPKIGEIVVFRSIDDPDYYLVKRVIGVPGDEVEYTEDGRLLINGKEVIEKSQEPEKIRYGFPESGLTPGEVKQVYQLSMEQLDSHPHLTWLRKDITHRSFGPMKIPPGRLLMMGDNRDNSQDSRYWGLLPEENILGRAMFVWLSCNDTVEGSKSVCDPAQIRWDRLFYRIR